MAPPRGSGKRRARQSTQTNEVEDDREGDAMYQEDEDEDEDSESEEASAGPSRKRKQRRKRRSSTPASSDEAEAGGDEDVAMNGADDDDGDDDDDDDAAPAHEGMVKALVRLALAAEHSRTPIRRTDISTKVLGPGGGSRQFRSVFEGAQLALRQTFGMEMVELPPREKLTLAQRRKAARNTDAPSTAASHGGVASATANKTWMLCSVLPEKYRIPEVIGPSAMPTVEVEGAYVGLYTFLITVITLSGGSMPESKLERVLRRCNADSSTPVDKTDKTLARMCKEGYLVREKETQAGEDVVEYFVGPRGRIEVGEKGVAGLVRTVWGKDAAGQVDADAELEKKLERSLKVSHALTGMGAPPSTQGGVGQTQQDGQTAGTGRRRRLRDDDDSDD